MDTFTLRSLLRFFLRLGRPELELFAGRQGGFQLVFTTLLFQLYNHELCLQYQDFCLTISRENQLGVIARQLGAAIQTDTRLHCHDTTAFRRPNITVHLRELFSRGVPLLILGFGSSDCELTPRIYRSSLVPVLNFAFAGNSFGVRTPSNTFRATLIASRNGMTRLIIFIVLVEDFAINGRDANGKFFAVLKVRGLIVRLRELLLGEHFNLSEDSYQYDNLLVLKLLFLGTRVVAGLTRTLFGIPIVRPRRRLGAVVVNATYVTCTTADRINVLRRSRTVFPTISEAEGVAAEFARD